jgi:hypothetical protein
MIGYGHSEPYCAVCGGFHSRPATNVCPGPPASTTSTADAQGEGNPPPCESAALPPWRNNENAVWQVVMSDGQHCLWIEGQWVHARTNQAQQRLAAEVVALRARVEELTELVEKAYVDGLTTGWCDHADEHGIKDGDHADDDEWQRDSWRFSDTRRLLRVGAETKVGEASEPATLAPTRPAPTWAAHQIAMSRGERIVGNDSDDNEKGGT